VYVLVDRAKVQILQEGFKISDNIFINLCSIIFNLLVFQKKKIGERASAKISDFLDL